MVRVNGRELMVDLMANPGTTYPANPASTAAFAQGPASGPPAVPIAPSLAQPIRPRQYQRSVSAASSGQVLQPACRGVEDVALLGMSLQRAEPCFGVSAAPVRPEETWVRRIRTGCCDTWQRLRC